MSNFLVPMLAARSMLAAAFLAMMALVPGPASAAEADVIVSDSFYQPQSLTVQAGSTVLWEQQGNAPHNVGADDGSWDSHPACTPSVPGSCMRDGDTYSRAFPETGTFGYYCKIHGSPGSGMFGTIRVVEPGFVLPTEVTDLRASRNGSTLRALGSASFGGISSLEVGTDVAGDSVHDLPAVLGFDLTKGSIGQPDPRTGDVTFMLDLVDLPPTGGVPEAAWYAWDLFVDPVQGDPVPFRISGSLTDLGGPNPMPDSATPTFTIRGCGWDGGTCPLGIPVPTVMNGEANRITVTVPTSALEQVAETSVTGAEISGGTFGFQGGVVTSDPQFSVQFTGPTNDILPISGTYRVAERTVALDLVPAGGSPAFDEVAALAADDRFEASLDVSGLAAGAYELWARACFGTNCATRSVAVTL